MSPSDPKSPSASAKTKSKKAPPAEIFGEAGPRGADVRADCWIGVAPRTSGGIQELLLEIGHRGRAMLLVTHDERLAARADRILRLTEGRLEEVSRRDDAKQPEAAPVEFHARASLEFRSDRSVLSKPRLPVRKIDG